MSLEIARKQLAEAQAKIDAHESSEITPGNVGNPVHDGHLSLNAIRLRDVGPMNMTDHEVAGAQAELDADVKATSGRRVA